jgi:hypothetical protein
VSISPTVTLKFLTFAILGNGAHVDKIIGLSGFISAFIDNLEGVLPAEADFFVVTSESVSFAVLSQCLGKVPPLIAIAKRSFTAACTHSLRYQFKRSGERVR